MMWQASTILSSKFPSIKEVTCVACDKFVIRRKLKYSNSVVQTWPGSKIYSTPSLVVSQIGSHAICLTVKGVKASEFQDSKIPCNKCWEYIISPNSLVIPENKWFSQLQCIDIWGNNGYFPLPHAQNYCCISERPNAKLKATTNTQVVPLQIWWHLWSSSEWEESKMQIWGCSKTPMVLFFWRNKTFICTLC